MLSLVQRGCESFVSTHGSFAFLLFALAAVECISPSHREIPPTPFSQKTATGHSKQIGYEFSVLNSIHLFASVHTFSAGRSDGRQSNSIVCCIQIQSCSKVWFDIVMACRKNRRANGNTTQVRLVAIQFQIGNPCALSAARLRMPLLM
jgi:hypothetical protein